MYGCMLQFGGRFALSIIFQGMIATDELYILKTKVCLSEHDRLVNIIH